MENEQQNKNIQNEEFKIKKRKTLLPIIVVIASIIIIVAVLFYFSFFSEAAIREREIKTHISNAEKYLDDLDYENAIAEYEAILKLDQRAEDVLDSYVDTVLAYAEEVAETNLDKATDILEDAAKFLDKISDGDKDIEKQAEKLNDRSDAYKSEVQSDSDIEESSTDNDVVNTSDNNSDNDISSDSKDEDFLVIDGIVHHAYKDVNLLENEKEYLDSIIDLCEEGNQKDAANLLEQPDLSDLAEKYMDENEIHILYRDYKIYCLFYNSGSRIAEMTLIPISDKDGYLLGLQIYIENSEEKSVISYGYCECENEMFNGKFKINFFTDETNSHIGLYDRGYFEGSVKNGLLDGRLDYYEDDNTNLYGLFDYGTAEVIEQVQNEQEGYVILADDDYRNKTGGGAIISDNPDDVFYISVYGYHSVAEDDCEYIDTGKIIYPY